MKNQLPITAVISVSVFANDMPAAKLRGLQRRLSRKLVCISHQNRSLNKAALVFMQVRETMKTV